MRQNLIWAVKDLDDEHETLVLLVQHSNLQKHFEEIVQENYFAIDRVSEFFLLGSQLSVLSKVLFISEISPQFLCIAAGG